MTRPDDSLLEPHQLATVLRHADRLLREASALRRFPTPVNDLMEAAKLVVVDDEVLNEGLLRRIAAKAKAGVSAGLATLKSAFSKVLGLFEAQERLVMIDKETPKPKVPFVKLHEAGHGTLPHQSKVYKLIHDCEKTLDADITDLFEREANVFASEVLFQGDVFAEEAHGEDFGVKVPVKLATRFGASNYATFRRYVITNPTACCVVVLEPPVYGPDGARVAQVRRIVMNKSFAVIYDDGVLSASVDDDHPLCPVIPANRMSFDREVVLVDRNGDDRICVAEAFNTKHQVLILIRDLARRTKAGIVLPSEFRFSGRGL